MKINKRMMIQKMINNRTIIISGSAHSGKTTFVNNLIHCFDEYYLIPEVSTIVINKWKESGRKFYWETGDIKDLRDFQEEVAELQYDEINSLETFIKEYPKMDEFTIIMDRSMEDILAYWQLYSGLSNDVSIRYFIPTNSIFNPKTTKVVVLPPKPFVSNENDKTIRFETTIEELNTEKEKIISVYKKYFTGELRII